jgi:serine phosphatase RsbU (regulator of sigma subunit)/anti-sigma regulatory factor (Ser/Thr protein kinase)
VSTLEISCALRLENPTLDQVGGVVERLLGFLRDQGVYDRKFAEEFQLAATEAINNAVEHGCAGAADPVIEVSLSLADSGVRLKVADPSDFAGWSGQAALPDDPLAERGRGRYLMQEMTDGIAHIRRATGHLLILNKRFAQPFWAYEPGRQEKVLEAMTEEAAASYEMIGALIGLGELLAATGDMEDFLEPALTRVCQIMGAEAACVRLLRAGRLVLIGRSGRAAGALVASLDPDGPSVEATAFRSGAEVAQLESAKPPPDDPLHGRLNGFFVTPILFKNERRGVLVLGAPRGAQFFTAAQLKIGRVVADYLGLVSAMHDLQEQRDREQRATSQLEIAAEIQMSLMPRQFALSPRFDIHGACLPAQMAGGDYLDVLAGPDGSLFAIVADVMGKGLPAALFANMLRTSIHARSDEWSDPAEILRQVNRILGPDLARLDMFLTAACLWIAPDGGTVREANAGHPPPLRLGRAAATDPGPSGFPIGILPDSTYTNHHSTLAPGEAVFLFTDGISEAADPDGRYFDLEELPRLYRAMTPPSAAGFVRAVLHRLEEFSEHAPPHDDRTALILIRKP